MTVPNWPTTPADIERHIQDVWTLGQYLAFMNQDAGEGGFGLHTDLALWAEDGITTAAQLADHLDGCNSRNVEKSKRYA